MKAHYLQHVPFEALGYFENVLLKKGHAITRTRLFEGDPFPETETVDLLIVMGGPMGVFDEDAYPWLAAEKRFIKAAIDSGKTVLGVCLGAQLIADVLEARVFPNGHREIGWFPLRPSEEIARTSLGPVFQRTATVFHWHGDTFDLPEGAVPVGSSDACRHQGFMLGSRVVALQFHLESTPRSVADLISHCGDELDGSTYVQDPAGLLQAPARFAHINAMAGQLLEAMGV
jgi:GMP synthase-like glutamine amidotransferase